MVDLASQLAPNLIYAITDDEFNFSTFIFRLRNAYLVAAGDMVDLLALDTVDLVVVLLDTEDANLDRPNLVVAMDAKDVMDAGIQDFHQVDDVSQDILGVGDRVYVNSRHAL